MLIDRTTGKTYSGRTDIIRAIGEKEFFRKLKQKQIDWVKCFYAD